MIARPLARATDPLTSRQAAGSLKEERLTACRQHILKLLRDSERFRSMGGGMTDEEVAFYWAGPPHSPSSIRTRRSELVDQGLVFDSGHTRLTRSGRKAIVWRAA